MDDAFAHIYDQGVSMCYGLKEAADQKANTFATEILNDDSNIDGISLHYVGGQDTCPTDTSRTFSL
jgi:hypothetical protein